MRRNARKNAKKRRITIITMLIAVFVFASCMTVGYAYFSDELTANMTFKTSAAPLVISGVAKSGVNAAPTSYGNDACESYNNTQQNWAVSVMNRSDYSYNYGFGGRTGYLYTLAIYEIGFSADEAGYGTRNCSAVVSNPELATPTAAGNGYGLVSGAYYRDWFLLEQLGTQSDVALPAGETAPAVDLNGYFPLSFPNSQADTYPKYTSAAALPIAITMTNSNDTDIDIIGYSVTVDSADSNLASVSVSQDSPITVAAGSSVDVIATVIPQVDGTFKTGTYVITLKDELGYGYSLTVNVG